MRLETHGPKPANPLINSRAIALCGQLHGDVETRIAWIQRWAERLYGEPIAIDGVLSGDVEQTLDVYAGRPVVQCRRLHR